MPEAHRQRIGKWGETAAACYLEGRGYRIIARNVRTPYGEIDLIASRGDGLVFVEVKTRTNLRFGHPESGVTARKLEHMIAAAQSYSLDHPDEAGQGWQIDVIAIEGRPGDLRKDVDIQHFENITQ
jgi:putative endonuclease